MENSNNEIKVFGTPTATVVDEPIKVVTQEVPETKTEQPVVEDVIKEVKQETVKQDVVAPKETAETKEVEVDEKLKVTDKTDKKDDSKPFEISFNSKKEEAKAPESPKETKEITEAEVLSYLKEKGIDVDDFSNLSKKEALSEDVAGFKKFKEETGRSLKDYYDSQRDWSKETKEDTIREFYKLKYPDLSDEDLSTQLDLLQVTEDDEVDMSERELKQKNLDFNKTYAEALGFMQKTAKEYSIPESKATQYQEPTAEDIAQAHRPYWDSRDKSLKNLNEIKISLGEVGDITLNLTPEHKDLLSKHTETQDSYFARWQKDAKTLKSGETSINTDSALNDTLWAIPEIRENMLSSMLEQAHALFLDKFSKENRNVNLNGKGEQPKIDEQKQSVTVFGKTETSKAGTPIF